MRFHILDERISFCLNFFHSWLFWFHILRLLSSIRNFRLLRSFYTIRKFRIPIDDIVLLLHHWLSMINWFFMLLLIRLKNHGLIEIFIFLISPHMNCLHAINLIWLFLIFDHLRILIVTSSWLEIVVDSICRFFHRHAVKKRH